MKELFLPYNLSLLMKEIGFDESPISGVMYKTERLKEKVEQIIGEPLSPTQEYFGVPDKRIEIFNYPLN
ncbi:MAG TPA: hypothetical protein VHA12_02720 [Candidatus Nanoarchaeia archaeon]|nr:hypothetical protein [Candidatus Nanoarchaeia archaeon]